MFKRLSLPLSVASFCVLGLGLSPNLSANACKGMEESACLEQGACIWVNGYERSDGRAVQGYCRVGTVKQSIPAIDPEPEAKIESESEPEMAAQG